MIKPGKSREYGAERLAAPVSHVLLKIRLNSFGTVGELGARVSLLSNVSSETGAVEQRNLGTNFAFNITLAICFPNLKLYSLELTGRNLERRLSGYSTWHASMSIHINAEWINSLPEIPALGSRDRITDEDG